MNAQDVQKWERTKELAKSCGVTLRVHDHGTIELHDEYGVGLGHQSTVAETYAFLCGYEYRKKPNQHT